MKNPLAFEHTADFSRELDGTGVKIDGEIKVEMIERSNALVIAEDFKLIRDIISRSVPKVVKDPGKNYMKSVRRTLSRIS